MWERLPGGDSAFGLRRLVTAFFLAAETRAAPVAESGCILPSESRTCARTNQRGLISYWSYRSYRSYLSYRTYETDRTDGTDGTYGHCDTGPSAGLEGRPFIARWATARYGDGTVL